MLGVELENGDVFERVISVSIAEREFAPRQFRDGLPVRLVGQVETEKRALEQSPFKKSEFERL